MAFSAFGGASASAPAHPASAVPAEGRVNPYSSAAASHAAAAAEMEARFRRIYAAMTGVPIPGRDFTLPGGVTGVLGYALNTVLLVLATSKDDNAILWFAVPSADGKMRVEVRRLIIDPEEHHHVLASNGGRALALMPHPEGLEATAFGAQASYGKGPDGRLRTLVRFTAPHDKLRERPADLILDGAGTWCLAGRVAGVTAKLERVYVNLKPGLTAVDLLDPKASIESVQLFAASLERVSFGQMVQEKVEP